MIQTEQVQIHYNTTEPYLSNGVICSQQQELSEPQIDPVALSELAGLPFVGSSAISFLIHDSNSKNETVGKAYFRTYKMGGLEEIAWYWNPQNGFIIISSRSELLNQYNENPTTSLFQFYDLKINESGFVAGSFLVRDCLRPDNEFNQCPWFWWSPEGGIHLSPLPNNYQLLQGLNNKGIVLISEISKSATLFDLNNPYYEKNVELPTVDLIEEAISRSGFFKKIMPRTRCEFDTRVNARSIDDNGKVYGRITIKATSLDGKSKFFMISLNFESLEAVEKIYVERIYDLKHKKIIYEHRND